MERLARWTAGANPPALAKGDGGRSPGQRPPATADAYRGYAARTEHLIRLMRFLHGGGVPIGFRRLQVDG